ncbi:hypothetical protein BDU57DRAFT_466729 [Ampelomyces quisqualis]|uniref:LIM zinc-binding domain-containing protein n=1 Tax=Ampelomyces quisqualis TaxID=50730 RepID=A0A6A5R601_AMPQU|nr:hypothetical protein BDU57DRAFT_466729 [Ampelomyces quisqualis]
MAGVSASGLPVIKCSSCGVDIDILQLADHVCVPPPSSMTAASATIQPQSPTLDRAGSFETFSNRSERPAPNARMRAPPRIDSNAANKPFRPLDPSPMNSSSDPRSRSPFLSPMPTKSPLYMNRSATSPMPRREFAPPSPTLSSSFECAFPPFPSKRSATLQSPKPQTRERPEPSPRHLYAEPSPLYAPLSPRFDGGDNVARRMDCIAPGPFDGRAEQRPSTSSSSKPPSPLPVDVPNGHRRTETQGSVRSLGSTSRQRTSVSSTMSRASAYSNRSVGLPSRPKLGVDVMPRPPLPSKPKSNEGIDVFLAGLQKESKGPAQARESSGSISDLRREGSRERNEPPPRPRRPSENQPPSNYVSQLQPSPFTTRPTNIVPLRDPSMSVPGVGPQRDDVHPLQTPSDSGLSDDSYASSGFRSAASSRSSPPGSMIGHSRGASKLSRPEHLGEAFERTTSPESYAERPRNSPPQEQVGGTQSHLRLNAPQLVLQPLSPDLEDPPESPMDPAIQMGLAGNRRPKQSNSRPELPSRPSSKGKCRGCSEPIVGKSVKDSSGRLTGRYHKNCFVCRTCHDPFSTAEFYVYENSPYCDRHYHELNGSMCASCDRGIEGEYLQIDARTKFHPRCFTCTTCRAVLKDDYYELNGQRYCDRHAQSAAAPPQNLLGPSGYQPRMEKRRTRLMMMA